MPASVGPLHGVYLMRYLSVRKVLSPNSQIAGINQIGSINLKGAWDRTRSLSKVLSPNSQIAGINQIGSINLKGAWDRTRSLSKVLSPNSQIASINQIGSINLKGAWDRTRSLSKVVYPRMQVGSRKGQGIVGGEIVPPLEDRTQNGTTNGSAQHARGSCHCRPQGSTPDESPQKPFAR